jgi:hypothetical protein
MILAQAELLEPAILQPLIQYGFAGVSAVLFGFVFWLSKNMLSILKENTQIIAQNTHAIQQLQGVSDHSFDTNTKLCVELKDTLQRIDTRLSARPCLANMEVVEPVSGVLSRGRC